MKQPLAFRLRPTSLDDIIGQTHLVGKNGIIRRIVEKQILPSLILFGPPGVGKTTIATVISMSLEMKYTYLNATTSSKKDIDILIEEAKVYKKVVLIMDEIHRLNKDKQDLLLPHIESGLIILIGTTTANPYHSINPAIRSRCHLLELMPLTKEDLVSALKKTMEKEYADFTYDEEAIEYISSMSGGDVRFALNNLELAVLSSLEKHLKKETITSFLKVPKFIVDKNEDAHYNAVSAMQKSIRGSDVNAALYYLAKFIESNDLESLERRLLVTAYEDIGLANPAAVARTIQAIDVAKRVGFPEARIPLAVAVIDLTLSPKSKSAYEGIAKATEVVNSTSLDIPPYLKLTPVNLDPEDMYPYGEYDILPYIQYLPEKIKNLEFYIPNDNSNYERVLKENYNKLKQNKRTTNIRMLRHKKTTH